MHTDQARAGVFADMYCQEKRQSEGLESDDAEEMLPFVANPMNHGSFGCTRKWETSVKQVLSTTHSDSFGRWLWREEL